MSRRGFVASAAAVVLVGCDDRAPARTDVPEPAAAPPVTVAPAGIVAAMPGTPEGLAISAAHGLVAVGVRDPDGVALVDVRTGKPRRRISLRGAARHLQMAGSGGAAAGNAIFVGDEFADTLSIIRGGKRVAVVPGRRHQTRAGSCHLTATNQLQSFRIAGGELTDDRPALSDGAPAQRRRGGRGDRPGRGGRYRRRCAAVDRPVVMMEVR